MIRKIFLATAILSLTTSCVSKKIYQELEDKYADLKKEHNNLSDENEVLLTDKNNLTTSNATLEEKLQKTTAERDQLAADYKATKDKLDNLKKSYTALEKNSNSALNENMKQNRALLAKLEAKQNVLRTEQDRLNKLKTKLEASSNRLAELEQLVADKEASMTALKTTLSNALNSFEGKGLTVENRNGKIYVSMENKLLFASGSWKIETEGKKAVQALSEVLANNQDISVLIEGHTDNDKIVGAIDGITNNWDLSTKRATAIVLLLLENPNVNKKNLTAAGRSQYAPLVANDTPEGKAKNRRIEIILSPNLDEITKLMGEL